MRTPSAKGIKSAAKELMPTSQTILLSCFDQLSQLRQLVRGIARRGSRINRLQPELCQRTSVLDVNMRRFEALNTEKEESRIDQNRFV